MPLPTWILIWMGELGDAYGIAFGGMGLVWVLSLVRKDSSLVDRFWGLGFVAIATWYLFREVGWSGRDLLVWGLVLIWGLRLSAYIHFRNRGKGEDSRYRRLREKRPEQYWWWSGIWVFAFQGLMMALISAPVAWVCLGYPSPFSVWDGVGLLLWGTGFFFEAVGDFQMQKFKADPENKGQVLSAGLWGWTRHPNYFGESLIWWGFFFFAVSLPYGGIAVFSPLLMTYFLLRVTGVTALETEMVAQKPEYVSYVRNVPSFFPRRPKAN